MRLSIAAFSLLAVAALSSLGSVGCHRVVVDDVRGPDGGDWKRISCRSMDKRCYKAAAELCPEGYYFARATAPTDAVMTSHRDEANDETAETATDPKFTAPHPQSNSKNVETLPPQETWGDEMYSNKRGTILVKCAGPRASASR